MDAFAVALATGMMLGTVSARQTFRLAWHFGLFQFLMPVLGWMGGISLGRFLSGVDHWIAFGLLAAIGARMVHGGTTWDGKRREVRDPTRGVSLVVLSVATSIDALAVGLSLGVLRVGIWYPAAVIGAVACALTAAGMHLGRAAGARLGEWLGARLEILGGLVLIGIGVRILVGDP